MMKELPGDVFLTGQIQTIDLQSLAEQGIMSFINNRPDMETPMQPLSEDMEATAQFAAVDYHHIPMSGELTPGLIKAARTAYANLPRPIVAFCASGTRSAALWCFAHVDSLGVDGVLDAVLDVGYDLEQIRSPLTSFSLSLEKK